MSADIVTINRIIEAVETAKSDLEFICEERDSVPLAIARSSINTLLRCLKQEVENGN